MRHLFEQSSASDIAVNVLRLKLSAVASDGVVRKLGEMTKYMSDTSFARAGERNPDRIEELLSNVILEMRRDCFEESELQSPDMTKLLPLGPRTPDNAYKTKNE